MLKKWLTLNLLISLTVFFVLFFSFSGVSGGDMAIFIFNIFFGLTLIVFNGFLLRKKEDNLDLKIIAFIFLINVLELIILSKWGSDINNFLR